MAGSGHRTSAARDSAGRARRAHRHVSDTDDRPRAEELDDLRRKRSAYYSGQRSSSPRESKQNEEPRRSHPRRHKSTSDRPSDSARDHVYPDRGTHSHRNSDEATRESDKSKGKRRSSGKYGEFRSASKSPAVPSRGLSFAIARPAVASRSSFIRRSVSSPSMVYVRQPSDSRTSGASKIALARKPAAARSLKRSPSTPHPTTPAPPRLVECLTCGSDDVKEKRAAALACGHHMCHSCLRRIFVLSTTDPAHMPPKCCTSDHIPLKHVENLVSDSFKRLWDRKYQEYQTANRIYCPSRKCGQWIKPSAIQSDSRYPGLKYASCKRCQTKVCVKCNNKYHKRSPCPDDPETKAFISSAKNRGWQQCYSCKAMVELKEGCNHMTCRCTAQFCMVCGKEWKTCDCPWFNHATVAVGDRLNHMRVPGVPAARADQRTYAEELNVRRLQERVDRLLAQRMQVEEGVALPFWNISGHRAERPRSPEGTATFAVGNSTRHLMNEHYVLRGPRGVGGLFDELAARVGRRGERAAAAPARNERRAAGPADAGLAPDAFGSASILNAAGLKKQSKGARKSAANFDRIVENGGRAQGAKGARIMGWIERVETVEEEQHAAA